MNIADLDFARELTPFCQDTALECFNCGTCAAVCPLVNDNFPRRMIRYIQVGARQAILENANDLWKCLHCGLCTHTCPRQADPGEIILGLKRFVVANWRRP